MKGTNKIPAFNSVEEEAKFWSEHDSSNYIDWSQAQTISLPNLKPSTVSISLRLPAWLLSSIKELANEKDVPYQSLMKMYLCSQLERELATRALDLRLTGTYATAQTSDDGWAKQMENVNLTIEKRNISAKNPTINNRPQAQDN